MSDNDYSAGIGLLKSSKILLYPEELAALVFTASFVVTLLHFKT